MDIPERLRTLRCFDHFSPQQLEQLAVCTSLLSCPEGKDVVRQDDTSLEAYAISVGGLEVKRQTNYGTFPLATLGPGELCGEISFLDHAPRSGTAVTTSPSELLSLNPSALGLLCDSDLRFGLALHWAFWRSVSQKVRQSNELLTRFSTGAERAQDGVRRPSARRLKEFRIGLAAKRSVFEEQRLSSMEINFLASLSREEHYGPGEVIFREGETGDKMFVVLDGQVRIGKEMPEGGEEALSILGRGDYFGEMALIENQPRSADARAHEGQAVVLSFSQEVVSNVLDIHKISSFRLLKILCGMMAKRLRDLDDKIIGWYILEGGAGPR